jgi:DNA-binding MarR family transcriptional regulator
MFEAVFGSVAAERTLLYLQNYGEGYARAIAETFGMSPTQASKQLEKLENGGVLISRSIGRARVYYWNERNPLVADLRRLLQSLLESLPPDEIETHYRQRRRPRRKGKPY